MFCTGLGLLIAGLLQPDHPLPPIRTAPNQTPISLTARPTSTLIAPTVMAFEPHSTPAVRWWDTTDTMLNPCQNILLSGPCVEPEDLSWMQQH